MHFRSYFFIVGYNFIFLVCVPATYPQSGKVGSIQATATVSSPIGLIELNSVSVISNDVTNFSSGWLLLSPSSGVDVICNGELVSGGVRTLTPSDKRIERVFERIKLPEIPGQACIVTVIYNEN